MQHLGTGVDALDRKQKPMVPDRQTFGTTSPNRISDSFSWMYSALN
jgi:hypothetical protein